MKKPINEENGS